MARPRDNDQSRSSGKREDARDGSFGCETMGRSVWSVEFFEILQINFGKACVAERHGAGQLHAVTAPVGVSFEEQHAVRGIHDVPSDERHPWVSAVGTNREFLHFLPTREWSVF